MQSIGNKKKNKKKDCSTCPNHNICLAEDNVIDYSCPLPDTPDDTLKVNNKIGNLFNYTNFFK